MQHCFNNNLKSFITAVCLFASSSASAITLSNANSVTEAQMETALSGTGVTISNLTITNPGSCANFRRGVGVFTLGTTAAGAGPVLSEPTGVIVANSDFEDEANGGANPLDSSNDSANNTNALCTGNTSDADMVTLHAGTANGEYAAIEFDVVPQFSTLAIPFQFGSEEFPEYVCSIYTDIVGIFVSGTGILGPYSNAAENYAKTSGGDLSSINWVNTGIIGNNASNACVDAVGGGSLANGAFYTDNSNGNLFGGDGAVALTNANLELDGFTNTLFEPIAVTAGNTYHVKIVVADSEDRTYDSVAFIHPLFSSGVFLGFDYGDAPDTYGTLTSNAGANHGVDTSIFMGTVPDNEVTGIPTVGADGDDLDNTGDEDGVATFPALLTTDTTYSVDVVVTNNSGSSATLVGWIDFDGSGTFESGEGVQTAVATGTTGSTVTLTWVGLTGLVLGDTYARFRFSTDLGLSIFTTGSGMSDGEVEDYTLPISGVTFTKYVSTNATCTDTLQTLTVAVGTSVYYCYTVTNPNAAAFTISASTDDQGHIISGLDGAYAGGASNTVIIGPLTAGGAELPTGLTTVNIASVTATISGSNLVATDTASLTVTATLPASGIKQLYFETVTAPGNLTRDPTNIIVDSLSGNITKNGGTLTLNQGIIFTAASPFIIDSGKDINVLVRARRRSTRNSSMQIELFNGNGGAAIGSAVSTNITTGRNVWETFTLTIPAASIPADVILGAGDFIQLVITNTSTGTGAINIEVRTLEDLGGGVIEKSQIQLESNTVINIDSLDVYAAPYAGTTLYSSYLTNSVVSIRASVSDPFGNADITGATITLDSPTINIVTNVAMTEVDTPTTETKVYEYLYDIGTNPEEGFWNVNVTANEGFEASVSHTETDTMIVGLTNISISKVSAVINDPINVGNFKSIPLAEVEYTITTTNTGFGYVNDATFVIEDVIPVGTRLQIGSPVDVVTFIDGAGATASGLSFDVTTDVEYWSTGGTVQVLTPTVDGTGKDASAPRIDLIKIKPTGEFNGSDTVDDPTADFTIRVIID